MGASFRNIGQILALSGCDLLTISPELLTTLAHTPGDAPPQLRPLADMPTPPRIAVHETSFRALLNEDAMASEKLGEGIRLFAADAVKLDTLIDAACRVK
jgi:transaldolase